MCCWIAGIYFLHTGVVGTQVDFSDLLSTKQKIIKLLLQSRILCNYLYFLQSNKIIYFWQHWIQWYTYTEHITSATL